MMERILKLVLILSLAAIEYQIEIYSISTYLTEFAAVVLFFYMLYLFVNRRISVKNVPALIYRAWLAYGSGILIVLIIHNTNNILEIIKYMIILAITASIFFCFYLCEDSKATWKTYCDVLIAMGVVVVLLGIFETYFNVQFPKRFDSIIWGKSNRMTSRFLLLIPLAYFRARTDNEIYYIPFYILITGVVMTVSRAGIIVLFIFFVFNAKAIFSRKNLLKTFSGFLFVFVVNYAIGIVPSVMYRCQVLIGQVNFRITEELEGISNGLTSDSVQSSISRLTLWKKALEDFSSNILFGIGVDKYRTYYMSMRGRMQEINAHNWVLQVLAETGIVGLAATVFFIICIFAVYRKVYNQAISKRNDELVMAAVSGAWSLIMYLLHNLMEASANSIMFGFGGVSVFVIIILAVTLGTSRQGN